MNLPKTSFPMRANASTRELNHIEDITSSVYKWQQQARKGAKDFTLHDGPPYANGDLHAGHFLNKSLKDFVVRYKLLQGYRIHYVPGWDCHGLPIEQKALASQNKEDLSSTHIRKLARECATRAIHGQKEDLIRWGVLADWTNNRIYKTLDKEYEVKQLQVFGKMVENGIVTRGLKPVFWSYSSGTALAEAEIEYRDDHRSMSCYVDFRILPNDALEAIVSGNNLYATIWTTTPWSLLSNTAISVHPEVDYKLVQIPADAKNAIRIIAQGERLENFSEIMGCKIEDLIIHGTVKGSELEGLHYAHPLGEDNATPLDPLFHSILCGDHVTTESGTGLVHTAPVHGHDDCIVWKQYEGKLENCPNPINKLGCFDASLNTCYYGIVGGSNLWKDLDGKHIHGEGSEVVIKALEKNLPVPPKEFSHRYPYDWRTKKPVIIQATEQWFVKLDGIKHLAKEALSQVKLFPDSSRLATMLEGRDEWCISRQRVWGVPIPSLFNESAFLMDKYVIQATCENISHYGSDWWFESEDVETVILERVNELRQLDGLEHLPLEGWTRGTDTLDVWFDSGCSWACVLDGKQADVYLEGSDQHRGWFQSSLLTKVASTLTPSSPFKHLVTHGFVFDDKQTKMSKSLGNVIRPIDVINGKGKHFGKGPAYGADVLRLWVASTDYTRDVNLGPAVVKDSSDSIRKIRNIARFLIGNLHDFQGGSPHLLPIDRYMLDRVNQYVESVTANYDEYKFRAVYSDLLRFISVDVSSIYAPCVKDRLYSDAKYSTSRIACQVVLWEILKAITLTVAPIAPFTAQDIFSYVKSELQMEFPGDPQMDTIFQSQFPVTVSEWTLTEKDQLFWNQLSEFKTEFNRSLNDFLSQGVVQSSEELCVLIPSGKFSRDTYPIICNFLQVAECREKSLDDGMELELVLTQNSNCPRCWRHTIADTCDTLCPRCTQVLKF